MRTILQIKKTVTFKFYECLLLVIVLFFQSNLAFADEKTKTFAEKFLESIGVDLSEAEIKCRADGSLAELFTTTTKFKSRGNSIVVDKINKELALFESAVVDDPKSKEKTAVDIFIKVPNVSRENLVDLLLNKKLVVSRNAQIIYVIKKIGQNGTDTFIYDGTDGNGTPVISTLYTQIRKLGNMTYKNEKYITANASLKIYFPIPPKKINSEGNLIDVLTNEPATVTCESKRCPLSDFDIPDLQDAFDKGLIDDIKKEAINGNNSEE